MLTYAFKEHLPKDMYGSSVALIIWVADLIKLISYLPLKTGIKTREEIPGNKNNIICFTNHCAFVGKASCPGGIKARPIH